VQEREGNTIELKGIGNNFLRTQMSQQLRQMGLHETEKLLHNKRNSHLIEEVTYRMGENLSHLYI
jgi:hypothetical protein